MKVAIAEHMGSELLIVLVEFEADLEDSPMLVDSVQPHYPTHPIVLAFCGPSGVQTVATFSTEHIIPMLDAGRLSFEEVDLSRPPLETSLPF